LGLCDSKKVHLKHESWNLSPVEFVQPWPVLLFLGSSFLITVIRAPGDVELQYPEFQVGILFRNSGYLDLQRGA